MWHNCCLALPEAMKMRYYLLGVFKRLANSSCENRADADMGFIMVVNIGNLSSGFPLFCKRYVVAVGRHSAALFCDLALLFH